MEVGTAEAAIGNSDVDLFIDEKGNIYLLCMTYTKFPDNLEDFEFSSMKGKQITIGVTKNEGTSWTWQNTSKNPYDDRPWITSTTDNQLHIIWNIRPPILYKRINLYFINTQS